jgi:DNA-binding Xre family transcriptional regulator
VVPMLEYKIDVIKKLKEVGINTTKAKESGVFGQATMKKFKDKDTSISLDNLNRLCCILEMQPRDIIKYVETERDKKEIISKIRENSID